MDERDILRQIQELAREQLEWESPLAPEQRLVEDLRLDSIRMLTLAVAVEDHFRIRLDESDEKGIVTVGDLVGAVQRKRHDRND